MALAFMECLLPENVVSSLVENDPVFLEEKIKK